MILRGFDETTMRKSFEWFLHDHKKILNNRRRFFNASSVPHLGIGSNANLTAEQMKESEKEFKNSMALLYLKTFYGKNPADFKTEAYRKECARLRSIIDSDRNSTSLKAKIEKCLRNGHVDYNAAELPRNIFYERLSNIGLSTDNINHNIFITPKFVVQARIYVNPSRKDYAHLMTFLYEKAASQELEIGTKTRMSDIGGETLDNMIIYTSAKDFPKIVEILNEYGKTYPEKVSQFGDTFECLGRSEQDWFGFGFDPQRSLGQIGTNRFSGFIRDMFNYYIFPATMFDDFGEITKGMNERQLAEIFQEVCNDSKLAREIALSLQDPTLRRKFVNNFCDLIYVKETSDGFTRENAKLSEAERNGRSPLQLRLFGGQLDDLRILAKENITIPLRNGSSVSFQRCEIARIMRNSLLRDSMEKFYNTEQKVQREVSQMLWLWKYAGKNMPYLNETYPFLSKDMVEEIKKYTASKEAVTETSKTSTEKLPGYERWLRRQTIKKGLEEKHKKQKEIIKVLCGGNYQLYRKLFEIGVVPKEIHDTSRENLERLFIKKIGLDEVIEASSYVKSLENENLYHRYENTMQALRHERGQELCNKIKSLTTKKEKNDFALTLSQYEIEDALTEYKWKKNIAKMKEDVVNIL